MFLLNFRIFINILLISNFGIENVFNLICNGSKENCKNSIEFIFKNEKINRDEDESIEKIFQKCYNCKGLLNCITPDIVECKQNENQMCFTILDDQNHVKMKGCENNIPLRVIENELLFTCVGNECNNEQTLFQATDCITCTSSINPNCAFQPKEVMTYSNCFTESNAICFSRLNKNGIIERGCASDLKNIEKEICIDSNSNDCFICTESLCNYQIFSTIRNNQNYLGIKTNIRHGMWQDLPLKCYTCEGEEKCKLELKENDLRICELNNEQDCMTVFSDKDKVIYRGCSDKIEDIYKKFCDEKPNRCFNCKSNGCNTANSRNLYKNCIYCESSKTDNCIWDPSDTSINVRMCQSDCMVTLYPVDMSETPSYELIRSCLDDMEILNQTQCTSETNKMCKKCKNQNCNIMDVDIKRLKCYICVGKDCEYPESFICPLFKENDKCFIWFDDTNSVKEMGCLSSLTNQISIEALYLTKRVLICDSGDNCNDLNRLKQPQKCAQCTSKQDINCAINPLNVATQTLCTQLPFTDCSSFITDTGDTLRGCLSDLPPKDYTSCLINKTAGNNCSYCLGNGCNREIFPKDRLQCYTCSSKDDPNCESFPEKTQPCPYLKTTEHCITSLNGNETERGCASQLLCDIQDKTSCRHCSKTGCNTIDLKNHLFDEDVGRWQNLPLKCHACSDELCQNSLGPALTCTGNDNQVCVTVFDSNGNVKRRGCSNDVEDYEDLYCRKNIDKCFYCKSNECNFAWNLTDYVDCIYCDSNKDPLCAINPENYTNFEIRKCFKSCMVAINGSHIIRSCLDDMEAESSQIMCKKNEIGNRCAKCTGNFCNSFIFPPDRLKCFKCTDSLCINTISEYCPLYSLRDACFAKYEFDDQVNYMGCESSENYQNLIEWKEKKQLFRCFTNDCNAIDKLPKEQLCINCNSLKTTECALDPSSINRSEICRPPFSECFIKITQDGATHRGCMQDLPVFENNNCNGIWNSMCNKCKGDRCNDKIFPKNRRSCYICNNYTCNDNNKEKYISICPVYASNDKCIIKKDENGFIEQGCLTEMSCITTDPKTCAICNYDACNIHNLISTAQISSCISFSLIIFSIFSYKLLKF